MRSLLEVENRHAASLALRPNQQVSSKNQASERPDIQQVARKKFDTDILFLEGRIVALQMDKRHHHQDWHPKTRSACAEPDRSVSLSLDLLLEPSG